MHGYHCSLHRKAGKRTLNLKYIHVTRLSMMNTRINFLIQSTFTAIVRNLYTQLVLLHYQITLDPRG